MMRSCSYFTMNEHNVVICRRAQKVAFAKEQALSLFECMEQQWYNKYDISYAYLVIISKLKPSIFQSMV